jgi:hypothetical protein
MHKWLVFLEVECDSQVATGECCYIDDIDVTDKHIYITLILMFHLKLLIVWVKIKKTLMLLRLTFDYI